MKRGEIWVAAARGNYAGKPRPVVVVQDDQFDANDSVTVVPITTDPVLAPIFRLEVTPREENGLRVPSRMMVDKVSTIPRSGMRHHIGRLEADDLRRLDAALAVFLGLAGGNSG